MEGFRLPQLRHGVLTADKLGGFPTISYMDYATGSDLRRLAPCGPARHIVNRTATLSTIRICRVRDVSVMLAGHRTGASSK